MKFLTLLVAFLLLTNGDKTVGSCTIRVEVSGIKVNEGIIGLMVFDQKEGFPTEKNKAIFSQEYKVSQGMKEIKITGLKPGKYAISLIHDVNGNRDLDKNFMGVPTEPFGFSGNKSILFGLPKFEDAAFEVKKGEVSSKIELIDLL